MPRSRLGDNVDRIRDAAISVFADRGYRRTRMADIAAAAGLSPGALYRYVESKDALLLLIFSAEAAPTSTFPVATPTRAQLVSTITERLSTLGQTPRLDAALKRRRPPVDAGHELRDILEERYDLVARAWPLLAVVERSSLDLPELFDAYFHRGRRHLTDKIARYLERRAKSGSLRAVADARLSARFLEESLTWFAWHRHGDPDSQDISESAARTTAIDTNFCALMVP
ncbi:MAG TPA: helix-turn-helix domain-containing protein [Mycobacteriales bacterium]|nr:helix-turn-helix domain-containing protein [Mycobacteriales bacterium]